MTTPPRMLTIGEAARYCRLNQTYFKEACPVKPVRFLGRVRRYDIRALDRWLDTLQEGEQAAQTDWVAGIVSGDSRARAGH